jgi:hypothetical protein
MRSSLSLGRTASAETPASAWGLLLCLTLTLAAAGAPQAGDTCPTEASAHDPSPSRCRFLTEDGVARFPFEVFHGDIRFNAEVNGRKVRMLLDDGFLWDQLAFWGSPRVDALGLDYDGEILVKGSDEGEGVASRTASGITLALPGVEFPGQTAIVTSDSSGVSKMWAGSEGQVSGTFLKNLVVDIDFDKMIISLVDPAKFEYDGKGVEIPWKPSGRGFRVIPATLGFADGRSASLDLAMDLGYNDQLLINTDRKHGIAVPERSLPESLGRDIQGKETLGYVGRVRRVEIGGYEVDNVVSAFIPEEQWDDTFDEVMIGLGLLSRFNLVFDYSRDRMFIEPNGKFSDPFEYDMSGLSLQRGRGDFLEVVRVHPHSPASEAGLRVGDRVTRINEKAAADVDIWELLALMRRQGQTIKLSVSREDKERTVSLTLHRLI